MYKANIESTCKMFGFIFIFFILDVWLFKEKDSCRCIWILGPEFFFKLEEIILCMLTEMIE